MRTFITLALASLFSFGTNAQSLTSPESVEYDPAYDRYLISNSGDGNIVARDQAGVITSFVTGIPSGPYGLEILDNTVYACAGSRVRGFDLATGVEVLNVNCGAAFLNGITTDGTFIYATDFGDGKIFKVDVDAETSSTFVANTGGTPNGIVYDPSLGSGGLWVAYWGSNAIVRGYDLNGVPSLTISTTLTNIDGITRDCFGNLYLASWSPDRITRVDITTLALSDIGWTVSNPADIDFDAVNARICIPNTTPNTVTFELVDDCVTGTADVSVRNSFTISPNPTTSSIQISNDISAGTYRILDPSSRIVLQGRMLENASIDVSELRPGIYFIGLDNSQKLSRFVRTQ